MRKVIKLLIVSLIFISCQEKSETIELLDAKVFATQIKDKNVQLIDVRTENEFTQGHIEKARNFDIRSVVFIDSVLTLDKNKAVYLYCRSGKRSKKASLELEKLGFVKIYDLKGGFSNWKFD